nr:immunoglobulin heavy chain junction region [Mus musculus]
CARRDLYYSNLYYFDYW